MTTRYFTARLLTDAVISERSATTGGHRTLDHIPGAALLGAVAGSYDEFGGDAFDVFHSGKVRFGNAYPLTPEGEPALPLPLAWHAAKGEELHGSVRGIKNLLHATDIEFEQWEAAGDQQKQLRSGYFTLSGVKVDPKKSYRLKTAISRDRQGMAEEAQLFGYQSLAAGSLWWFAVSFADGLPDRLIDTVVSSLTGTVRVGRSRSAEYGLLTVQPVEKTIECPQPVAGDRLIIYCASDVALVDAVTGAPTLIPTGAHFNTAGALFDPAGSYLRTRSYAPFNRTRKRFDLERQVIAKGSVLVFTRQEGIAAGEALCIQQRGAGLYRQDGLGQILVNPAFLAGFKFKSAPSPELPLPRMKESAAPPDLARWLTVKAAARRQEIAAIEQVDLWIHDLVAGSCPRNSQWGQLRNIALLKNSVEELRAGVAKLCTTGVSQKQWDKQVKVGGRKISYANFLLHEVLAEGIDLAAARHRLFLLGNRLPRRNNQRNGGDR